MNGIAYEISDHWRERYQHNRDGYPQLLEMDPFDLWERNAMPESTVEGQLDLALKIAYARGHDDGQSVAFLHRAALVAQRAIDEDKLTSPTCEARLPYNRAALYRAYTYTRALLRERLDEEALRQSSRDFEEWSKTYKKREWDSQAQADYLASVRLALVMGDLDRAAELLKTKKSFKWHLEEHALWKDLIGMRGSARDDADYRARYDRFFDRVRDPRFKPTVYMELDIVRLETAAIRDKYLVSGDGVIDWERVVNSIAT